MAKTNKQQLLTNVMAGDGKPMKPLELPAWGLPTVMESLLQTSHVLIFDGDARDEDEPGHYVGVRRKEDGTHELLDCEQAEPEPVDARALYEKLARRTGALICAVPGGCERPAALMRYDGWLHAEKNRQIGQALADVLGAVRLKDVIDRAMTKEAAQQEAAGRLPQGSSPLTFSLPKEVKAYFLDRGCAVQSKGGAAPSVDHMRNIEAAFNIAHEEHGFSRALLFLLPHLLIPVYLDSQKIWRTRVPAEKGSTQMVTRRLNDVMRQQQDEWDERRQEAEQRLGELDKLPQEDPKTRQERAEVLRKLAAIDRQRLAYYTVFLDRWPGSDVDPQVCWAGSSKRWDFKVKNPDNGRTEVVRAISTWFNDRRNKKNETKALMDEFMARFNIAYERYPNIDVARETADAEMPEALKP